MILVTGANGHVGNNLVRALLDRGHSVRAQAFGRMEHIDSLPIERVQADLRDPGAAHDLCRGVDTVFTWRGGSHSQ